MVLGIAGAAAAYQPQGGPAPRGDFRRGPELSQEDRAHFEAMRKVRAELRDALREAMKRTGPVLIDAQIDKDERVLPMIPAGGTVDDLVTE